MTSHFIQALITSSQHAFAVLGEPVVLLEILKKNLPTNSPDVWVEMFDNFNNIDSQRVKTWQSTKPLNGLYKYAVWGITSSNMEAQNALLKTLEEPATDTKIFIVIPHEGILLPTVLSRLVVVRPEGDVSLEVDLNFASQFLNAEPHQRLELLSNRFNYDDETIKGQILTFLSACERLVAKKIEQQDGLEPDYLEIIEAKKNISDRSAVPRLVLEHVAVVLPKNHQF